MTEIDPPDREAAERFLRRAIELSRQGMEAGDGGPFGAVVVRSGQVLGEGWNRVVSNNDPTAHAEVEAIRAACRGLGTFQPFFPWCCHRERCRRNKR